MLALGATPALLQAVGMVYLPESPRWLAANGKEENAKRVLDHLRGANSQAEFDHIVSSAAGVDSRGGNSWRAQVEQFQRIWRNPGVRTALVTGMSLQFFQQIIGINAIMYYSGITFKTIGFDDRDALLMSLAVASVGMLSSMSSLRLIDALGRRKLFLLSNAGVIVCLGAVGIAFAYKITWFNVVAQCGYVACFQCGLGPIPWTMNAEIYPLWARSTGSGISTFVNWSFTFLVSATFLSIHDAVGDGNVFLIYGGCSVVSLIYFYFRLPETSGLSLEEVEQLFQQIASLGSYQRVATVVPSNSDNQT
jgi:sugar porter (SP) family MFS transporter